MGVLEEDFCFKYKYSSEFKYSLEVKRLEIFAKHFQNKSMAIDIDVNSQKEHVHTMVVTLRSLCFET